MAEKKNIAESVRELVEPVVSEMGYSIWDVDYSKIGSEWHLEITLDSEKGIDLSDCEKVHGIVDELIDGNIEIENYDYLDVSSPGLERVIKTPEHYEKCVGQTVEIKLFTALDGKKSLIGELSGFDKDSDTAKIKDKSGKELTVARKLISKANVYFEI